MQSSWIPGWPGGFHPLWLCGVRIYYVWLYGVCHSSWPILGPGTTMFSHQHYLKELFPEWGPVRSWIQLGSYFASTLFCINPPSVSFGAFRCFDSCFCLPTVLWIFWQMTKMMQAGILIVRILLEVVLRGSGRQSDKRKSCCHSWPLSTYRYIPLTCSILLLSGSR